MSLVFTTRSYQPERMDFETLDPETTTRILRALERVNDWLGGVRATLWHLERFSKHWAPAQTIRILDWGTGGADIPRAIVRWARREGHLVQITGIDHSAPIAAYAREACRDYPEIRILEAEAGRFSPEPGIFDYAISSLTLHHLRDDEIVSLLRESDRAARRGIIMNDLKRSARAWAWIWSLTHLGWAHSIVRNDAPLSVKRAFTQKELEGYAAQAGLSYLKVDTFFGYRMTLAGEKNA
jgi:ubiquinone/menaquinone biosynthesis C-methylase UbiE